MRRDLTFSGKDGTFHVIDWGGSGPAAHVAHATGFCAGINGPLAERLVPRLHVLSMDDRGHGKTTAPADPRRLKDWDPFVEDLERFFETLGEPVVAMGHSRGGMVSLLLAVKRPDLVRALVLLDPTILPLSWMWWWFLLKKTGQSQRVPIAARAARRKRVWPDRETIRFAYSGKGAFKDWKDGFLDAYIEDGTEETQDGRVQLCCDPAWESRCFASCPHDMWRSIRRLTRPTLFLYGARSDVCLAPAVKRFRSYVPHTRFHRFEQTGHFVPMERPGETADAILRFIEETL